MMVIHCSFSPEFLQLFKLVIVFCLYLESKGEKIWRKKLKEKIVYAEVPPKVLEEEGANANLLLSWVIMLSVA